MSNKYSAVDESIIKRILSCKTKNAEICYHKSKYEDMTLASALTVSGSNVLMISKNPARSNKYYEYSLY